MAVLPQVWVRFNSLLCQEAHIWRKWGFGSDPDADANNTRAALLAEITSNPLAPFVFHSVAFGSEPIGDGADGGLDSFTTDFIAFKAQLAAATSAGLTIPATISEAWDRSQLESDNKLTSAGQKLMSAMDLVHAVRTAL
jgi:hypothetical protein